MPLPRIVETVRCQDTMASASGDQPAIIGIRRIGLHGILSSWRTERKLVAYAP